MRRGPNHPNLLLYGLSSRSSHAVVEIHSNDFGQDDDDEEKDEDDGNDEASKQSVSWLVEEKDEITALVFDESTKQAYMAVNNGQTSSIYRFAVSEECLNGDLVEILYLFFDRKIFTNQVVRRKD